MWQKKKERESLKKRSEEAVSNSSGSSKAVYRVTAYKVHLACHQNPILLLFKALK